MSAPTPVVRGDLLSAVRKLVVDQNTALGTGVYRDGAQDDPKTPYAILSDAAPSDGLSGDGGTLTQIRTVLISIVQSNQRDANVRLAHGIADALHGKAVLVGVEAQPDTWRRVVLRCRGRVDATVAEGIREDEITVSCYGPPVP